MTTLDVGRCWAYLRGMANLIDTSSREAAASARAARHPEKQKRPDTPVLRKPEWIRVKAPLGKTFSETQKIVKDGGLVTVCEEARWQKLNDRF